LSVLKHGATIKIKKGEMFFVPWKVPTFSDASHHITNSLSNYAFPFNIPVQIKVNFTL